MTYKSALKFLALKICFIFLSLFVFLASVTFAAQNQELYEVSGCAIRNLKGEIVRDYGTAGTWFCAFFDDGKIAIANSNSLTFYSPEMKKLWQKTMHVHHKLTLTEDQKYLLVMSSEILTDKRGRVRGDLIHKIDFNGKIIASLSLGKNLMLAPQPFEWDKFSLVDTPLEVTHLNSIKEIPQTEIPVKGIYKSAKYIINDTSQGIFLLDERLQILREINYSTLPNISRLHDVQVLPNGHLLVFSNGHEDKNGRYSSVDEIDLEQKKTTWRYIGKPPKSFYAYCCGGMQRLENGNTLITSLESIFETTPSGKIVSLKVVPLTCAPSRRLNLSSFLDKNTGP